uniref:RZ-type domain-containing protein n=1 Tax=Timema bartmani TaxID=61472 RepID=A0A7R9EMN3_9NEOP|nr:unnamed protein product [Timema bartmani]
MKSKYEVKSRTESKGAQYLPELFFQHGSPSNGVESFKSYGVSLSKPSQEIKIQANMTSQFSDDLFNLLESQNTTKNIETRNNFIPQSNDRPQERDYSQKEREPRYQSQSQRGKNNNNSSYQDRSKGFNSRHSYKGKETSVGQHLPLTSHKDETYNHEQLTKRKQHLGTEYQNRYDYQKGKGFSKFGSMRGNTRKYLNQYKSKQVTYEDIAFNYLQSKRDENLSSKTCTEEEISKPMKEKLIELANELFSDLKLQPIETNKNVNPEDGKHHSISEQQQNNVEHVLNKLLSVDVSEQNKTGICEIQETDENVINPAHKVVNDVQSFANKVDVNNDEKQVSSSSTNLKDYSKTLPEDLIVMWTSHINKTKSITKQAGDKQTLAHDEEKITDALLSGQNQNFAHENEKKSTDLPKDNLKTIESPKSGTTNSVELNTIGNQSCSPSTGAIKKQITLPRAKETKHRSADKRQHTRSMDREMSHSRRQFEEKSLEYGQTQEKRTMVKIDNCEMDRPSTTLKGEPKITGAINIPAKPVHTEGKTNEGQLNVLKQNQIQNDRNLLKTNNYAKGNSKNEPKRNESKSLPAKALSNESKSLPAKALRNESKSLPAKALSNESKSLPAKALSNESKSLPAKALSNEKEQSVREKKKKPAAQVEELPYKIINYKKLETLVNSDASDLLADLANRHTGFENRLREKLSPDWIMLIAKALAKLCKVDFQKNKERILSQACEPDFLDQVAGYLMKLPFEEDVKRAYQSVEHYLDVQFRLLREDFLIPLREGITELMSNQGANARHSKRFNQVRIYHKVYFRNPAVVKDKVGLEICFDPDKRLTRLNWESSRRFMFGSLLCFTKDNFTNIFFAIVIDRSVETLKKGRVVVELKDVEEFSEDLFQSEFILVECQVYFEPYYHVLKALQVMHPETFPMRQYVIDVNVSNSPPSYVLRSPDFEFDIDGHIVPVTDETKWPSAKDLHLDDSQYKAFKSALTNEFVVIQGPPGTGKTYLGLKIAKVLLENAPVWNATSTPILVVCFTNHALDQFLEGILQHTRKLIRIGGQSKSEVLADFNLKECRRVYPRRFEFFQLMRDIKDQMSHSMVKIKQIQLDLEGLRGHRGVVSLSVLKITGLPEHHLKCFNDGKLNDDLLLEWLEEDIETYEDYQPQHVTPEATEEKNEVEIEEEEDEDRMWNPVWDDILEFGFDLNAIIPNIFYVLDLDDLHNERTWLSKQINYIANYYDPKLVNKRQGLLYQYHELGMTINYWKTKLKAKSPINPAVIDRLSRQTHLWELPPADRWILYRHWIDTLTTRLLNELSNFIETHRQHAFQTRRLSKRYEEVRQMGDLEVMKDSLVVGMTTTGAARLQPLLQALKPRIVIVEEAAEVMESHIIVSLTHHCQHLILIGCATQGFGLFCLTKSCFLCEGDHKQLRPTTAVFKLAREYNFDISLFERMVKNGMHCQTLQVQHRMRPEIAQLIVPTIYPVLHNHESVQKYSRILGLVKSVYFITHNHLEEEVVDTQSRRNLHEGKYLIALARYLVLQGYSPEQITILTTYSGQLFYLRSERKNHHILKNVRISVVDNFQGEENDIILLSLVRSNPQANIGFLKTENRVCVALSRAKKGLYIVGNMDNLTQSSTIWPVIRETLVSQEALGTHLTLRCQIHTTQFTRVGAAEDFHSVPEGGCSLLCEAKMPCGHLCKSICHILNREHTDYKCMEPCERSPLKCPMEHDCKKLCWENCGECMMRVSKELPCGHIRELRCFMDPLTYKCPEMIAVELPDCGHEVEKPCHRDLAIYPCNHPCENRLPCGHSCERNCHLRTDPDHIEFQCMKPCAKKNSGCSEDHMCQKLCYLPCGDCLIEVKKTLPGCDHLHKVPCSSDPSKIVCQKRCIRYLNCGHPCPRKCNEPCGGCPVKVTKVVPQCGHQLTLMCSELPLQSRCRGSCLKMLKCGHQCDTLCCSPCTSQCKVMVPCRMKPACCHSVMVPCYKQDLKLSGWEGEGVILPFVEGQTSWEAHDCPPTVVCCGSAMMDPYSEELLSFCQVPCGTQLECGHRCRGTCGECLQGRIHKACVEKCGKTLICGHRCNIPCSESCPPCNRKCNLYRCKHSRCNEKCGEPCTPCKEFCDWECEHQRCTRRCHEICDRQPCQEPCNRRLECGHPCIGFCGETCPKLCRVCDKDQVMEIFFGQEDEDDARFVYLEDCKHIFESRGLEEWMKLSDGEIKTKVCPKCTTPITKTQRYMNIVKQVYNDVNAVKRKVFGFNTIEASIENRVRLMKRLTELTSTQYDYSQDSDLYRILYNKLEGRLKGIRSKRRNKPSAMEMETLRVQIEVLCEIHKMVNGSEMNDKPRDKLITRMDVLLTVLLRRQDKLSNQEVEDIKLELMRFHRITQLLRLESEFAFRANALNHEITTPHQDACKIAYSIEKYTPEQDQDLRQALERFKAALNSAIKIIDKERNEIVTAMGLKQGHWYKCPNGHPYVITECGGAMVVGKCNECGAAIGGSNHRLLSSNQLASEMDGAVRPAWPR